MLDFIAVLEGGGRDIHFGFYSRTISEISVSVLDRIPFFSKFLQQ